MAGNRGLPREEIEELLSRYCRIVDRKAYQRLSEIFWDDVVVRVVIQGLRFDGIDAFIEFLNQTKDFSTDRMHFTSNLSIRPKGSLVEGFAYWHSTMTFKGVPIVEGGWYDMEFKKKSKVWKFSKLSIFHKYRSPIQVKSWHDVGFPGEKRKESRDEEIFLELHDWFS